MHIVLEGGSLGLHREYDGSGGVGEADPFFQLDFTDRQANKAHEDITW